ncbi:TlpA disulfide reductase family protein [Fusobacterium sp. THCT13E1]
MNRTIFAIILSFIFTLYANDNNDFLIKDLKIYSLEGENIIPKKKKTLYNFSTSWCSFCQNEKKYLKELKNKNKDLEIILIFLDTKGDTVEEIKNYIKTENLNFLIAYDFNSELKNKLKIKKVPYNLLFDKDGKIEEIIDGEIQNFFIK